MKINIEGMINKLEYKVNEFTIRNTKIEKLGLIKDRLEFSAIKGEEVT